MFSWQQNDIGIVSWLKNQQDPFQIASGTINSQDFRGIKLFKFDPLSLQSPLIEQQRLDLEQDFSCITWNHHANFHKNIVMGGLEDGSIIVTDSDLLLQGEFEKCEMSLFELNEGLRINSLQVN